MKFLLTDFVPPTFIPSLEKLGIECVHMPEITTPEVMGMIHDFDGIVIKSALLIDSRMLAHAQKLKYILRPGSGLDNIDQDFARSKGIAILSSPEGNSDAVAEHTLGLLLCLTNNIFKAAKEVSDFQWIREENRGEELSGKNISVIGYGNTGSAFTKRLSALNVNILVYDKYKSGFSDKTLTEVAMDEIYEKSDVVSLHLPLTAETRHLVNDDFLGRFKKPIYFLNTSRGDIVDLQSLLNSIEAGKIKAAALDVLPNENLKSYSQQEKQMFNNLHQTGKVVITPHIAGWSKESGEKTYSILVDKLSLKFNSEYLPQAGLKNI